MVTVIIREWNKSSSWTDWGGHEKDQFLSRVRERTSISNTDLKRLARDVLNRKTDTIKLDLIESKNDAEPVRHLLESLGATVEIN